MVLCLVIFVVAARTESQSILFNSESSVRSCYVVGAGVSGRVVRRCRPSAVYAAGPAVNRVPLRHPLLGISRYLKLFSPFIQLSTLPLALTVQTVSRSQCRVASLHSLCRQSERSSHALSIPKSLYKSCNE